MCVDVWTCACACACVCVCVVCCVVCVCVCVCVWMTERVRDSVFRLFFCVANLLILACVEDFNVQASFIHSFIHVYQLKCKMFLLLQLSVRVPPSFCDTKMDCFRLSLTHTYTLQINKSMIFAHILMQFPFSAISQPLHTHTTDVSKQSRHTYYT